MRINVIKKSKHELTQCSTQQSAGMELRANPENDIILKPLERILVPTVLFMEIPVEYEEQIRPRSGLTIKKGVNILNSLGAIDADYRGEVCIIPVNLSTKKFVIEDGERICQIVIAKQEKAELESVDILLYCERGVEWFGHTGKN
jgi:dUTP pyrophosphatase